MNRRSFLCKLVGAVVGAAVAVRMHVPDPPKLDFRTLLNENPNIYMMLLGGNRCGKTYAQYQAIKAWCLLNPEAQVIYAPL